MLVNKYCKQRNYVPRLLKKCETLIIDNTFKKY